MDTFLQDFRYGVRNLLRQRGSSIVAIVTLALGIGASTAIFSVVDAAMLRPLPYPKPEQLVSVNPEQVMPDGKVSRATASMEDMRFMQKADDVFSQVAAWGSAFRGRIAEGPEPERIQVAHLTEDYLPMHGVTPQKGRGFTLADMQLDAPLVALLGHGYWQSRFGGGDVLGQTIRLEEDIAEIVGVLPPWFNASTPVSIPHRVPPAEFGRRGTGRVSIYARLRDGVTIEQARERMSARMATWAPSGVGANPGVGRATIESRLDDAASAAQTTVNILLGAVGLILLIACVNVAGLLLARGANRQGELAVRAAMGASRWRLIRQVLTESVVLVIPGAALGVLLAWLTLDAIVANIPLSLPSNSPVTLNLTVLAATVALLVPTVLLFGLAPAIKLSRVRLGSVLARGGRQRGSSLSRRGSQLLIGVEIALAVVLVAGAGLMIRSFARIGNVALGFNASQLVTMEVLPLDRTPGVHKEYYTALVQRIRTVSGVTSAGLVDYFALGGGTRVTSVRIPGATEWTSTTAFRTLPGYFETIGAALKQGRWPTEADHASGHRGAVINETAARALFPEGGAIGREISGAGSAQTPWTVIGVVADLRHGGPLASTSRYPAQVFFPLELTQSDITTPMTVVMRVEGAPANLPDQLRKTAQSIGPRVLVERIRTSEALFSDRVITPRRRMVLLSLLGGLGLILALVGVFGMTAYAVARRTPEIGVRLAFGARPRQIVGTMLRESAWPILLGTVVGVGGALLATRVIETFLFETSPTDAMTLAAVAGLLATVGCLAAIVPALRAATVDPLSSLRAE